MDDDRMRCAESALRTVPEDYRTVDAADLAGQEGGHSFHRGMHIGWVWGADERGQTCLDFLSEHRLGGMSAERYFADGRTESIAVPAEARTTSPDPTEDAKLEQKFLARNRAAYEELRDRGLLPPQGANLASQDINEYLLTGGPEADIGPATGTTVAGARGVHLGGGWDELLREELDQPYWTELLDFVTSEYQNHAVYPPWAQVFTAFELTPVDQLKVVILGQDPYIRPGQAHGLAFSVPTGTTIPPSLRNIRNELAADLRIRPSDLPNHGDLTGWAEQGVLLLNTTLTVRRGESNSHQGKGWETFTDAVIRAISTELTGIVFILWGQAAQKKAKLIDTERHPPPITAAHPRARSNAHHPFAGSKPFTTATQRVADAGKGRVDWARLGRSPHDS